MWSQLFFKWRWIQFRIVCIVQSFQVKTWQLTIFFSRWSLIIFKFSIFFSFCLGCKLWKCSRSLTATWPFEACWTWESIASANSIFTIPTGNKRGSKTTLLFNFCQVKIQTWVRSTKTCSIYPWNFIVLSFVGKYFGLLQIFMILFI